MARLKKAKETFRDSTERLSAAGCHSENFPFKYTNSWTQINNKDINLNRKNVNFHKISGEVIR